MSIWRCPACDRLIDLDYDDEHFDEDMNPVPGICPAVEDEEEQTKLPQERD